MAIRTRVAALLGAVGIVAVSLVSGGPAAAQTLSVRDGHGDVWRREPTSYTPTDQPAGTQLNADVLRTTVAHLRRQVRVGVHYADLAPSDGAWQFEVLLRTDADAVYDVVVTATSGDPSGSVSMWEDGDPSYSCKAVQHTLSYATDVVTLSIPRRCLGRPASVRFLARAEAMHWSALGTEVDYNDDALSPAARSQGAWSTAVSR